MARRALPGGPDRHAHRAQLALQRRDHYLALRELALVDPVGPHGAWAAAELAWHRAHGLAARYFSDPGWERALVARTEYALAYHVEMTPGQPFEMGAASAVFTALLEVPEAGTYDFSLDTRMRGTLLIDQQVVLRELKKNQGWRADGSIDLTRGPHELAILLRPGTGQLEYRFWSRRRGEPWGLLPVGSLSPAPLPWVEPLLPRLRAAP